MKKQYFNIYCALLGISLIPIILLILFTCIEQGRIFETIVSIIACIIDTFITGSCINDIIERQ